MAKVLHRRQNDRQRRKANTTSKGIYREEWVRWVWDAGRYERLFSLLSDKSENSASGERLTSVKTKDTWDRQMVPMWQQWHKRRQSHEHKEIERW